MSDFDYRTSPELSAEYAEKAEAATTDAGLWQISGPDRPEYTVDTDGPEDDETIVDGPGLDHPAASLGEVAADQGDNLHSLATLADLQAITQQLDDHGRMLADLHAKVDHLNNGMGAVYAGVDHLVKMLSAVQQVASMMPGGKKLAQAMQKNGEQ
jgi:hypothetical protein